MNDDEKSTETFSDLPLSMGTVVALDDLISVRMTWVQAKAIPLLLERKDLVACSRNGSGKTLAFIIPAFDHLCRKKYEPDDGIIVMVLCPTTMLALQLEKYMKRHLNQPSETLGCAIGSPKDGPFEGKNILIATPDGLLYHLRRRTKGLKYDKLEFLIFDDPDLILRISYRKTWNELKTTFPKELQIAIFSVTEVKHDHLLCLLPEGKRHTGFDILDVDKNRQWLTSDGLEQEFILVPCAKRLIALYIMLKTTQSKKVMVFFSSPASVKFHQELFTFLGLKCHSAHDSQSARFHSNLFPTFYKAKEMILLCNNVTTFGLHVPGVDLIVQYDPPYDPKEYIHKVGRTARGTRQGKAVLFLMPHELRFISRMKDHKVLIREHMFDEKMAPNVGSYLVRLVAATEKLMEMAKEAYVEYITKYNLITMKDIFSIHHLDRQAVAASFCLWDPVGSTEKENTEEENTEI